MKFDRFRVELLNKHDRTSFDCGVELLNNYFRTGVGQDIRRRVTTCYVVVHRETASVAGYYTLAAGGVSLGELPQETGRRLPRYPSIPVIRIGRLAINQEYQGCKLGSAMLFDAIKRADRSGIGAYAILVDAKDAAAVAFYEHHGFTCFESAPMTLYLPVSEGLKKLIQ